MVCQYPNFSVAPDVTVSWFTIGLVAAPLKTWPVSLCMAWHREPSRNITYFEATFSVGFDLIME
jgi:hypothetical protein